MVVNPGAGGAVIFFKVLIALLVFGGGGWFAYTKLREPKKEVAAAPAKPVVVEAPRPVEIVPPVREEVPPPVVVKEPEPPPVPPPPKAPDPLPGLPAFDRIDALTTLVAATTARVEDGRWKEHRQRLQEASREIVVRRARLSGPKQLDFAFEKGALPLALAQMDLMNRLGDPDFADWVSGQKAFATRVLTQLSTLENFLNSLLPQDQIAHALRIWEKMDARAVTPQARAKYENLAIALALIYDKPSGTGDALEIYDYYVKADERSRLYVDFPKIPPDELVWGVGPHPFGIEGMEWALSRLRHPYARLGAAYAQVPYKLNHPPYPTYTLENILKLGGVCEQQAQFSEANARAHGVPSAYIAGEGSRGGHAWLAYRTSRGWDNGTGRYSDGYACGHARNPQTGKSFREWDFVLYDDPGRRNGDREAALRLLRAAEVLETANDTAGRMDLLEAAARRNPGNPVPWRAWIIALLEGTPERPLEFWQQLVNDYRVALKRTPDFFALSDRVEAEKIFPRQDPDRVGEFLRTRRRQSIRENKGRFDLLIDSVRREAEYYKSRNDTRRIGLLYNNALRTYGDNLPTFIALSGDFSKAAENSPEIRRAALTVMENVFNQKIDSKLKGDAFRLPMEAKVCKTLSKIFANDDNTKKAERYARRAEEISRAGDAKRAAMD